MLNLCSLFFLIKPKLIGIKVAYSALIAAAIYNLLACGLGLLNIEGMKQAYRMSKESMRFPVQEEALPLLFSPTAFAGMLGASLLVYILIAFLISKRKAYFRGQ